MNLIMACIDFSDVTPVVVESAAQLARATGARLLIAHVVLTPSLPQTAANDDPPPRDDLVGERVHLARLKLMDMRDHLLEQFGLGATILVLEGAKAAPVLLEECAQQHPDLVILGSHGHGPPTRLMLGGTSHDILCEGEWPVLVIPSIRHAAAQPGLASAAHVVSIRSTSACLSEWFG